MNSNKQFETYIAREVIWDLMQEPFIDVDDLAEFLKIKKRTAYHFVVTLNIPHYRVGRLLRFKLSEVEEWMKTYKSEQFNLPYNELERI